MTASRSSESTRPRVAILGGGFGGLQAAKALRKAPVDVVLVDRRNHHLFQPLLYQVATAALNPSNIASPIRRVFRSQKNVEVILGDALAIDAAGKRLVLADGTVPYDYLIVAAGAAHSYFGHDEWAEFAPGLKSTEDATAIRRKVLTAFEAAEREDDPTLRKAWLTFVIVGGGPSGVEMSGALAEISRHVLSRDFRRYDPKDARIILIEGGKRILPGFAEDLSKKAQESLTRLGVEVRLGESVTEIDAEGVAIGPERIAARTVLWAAGVAGASIAKTLGVPLDKAGRVRVGPDLTIPGHPEVFVIGDLATLEQDGKPLPGVAQVAMQGGKHASRTIVARLAGKSIRPFRYFDKGNLATIGRASAVAEIGKLHFSGFLAWVLWLGVHIVFLIGFRNRVALLLEWAWIYFTYERGARIITGPPVLDLLGHDEPRPTGDGPVAPDRLGQVAGGFPATA